MANERYIRYINDEVKALAVKRYPNNHKLQLIYHIGFLQAQLAQAMELDSKTFSTFNNAIEAAQAKR